jgi:hypothetical protein
MNNGSPLEKSAEQLWANTYSRNCKHLKHLNFLNIRIVHAHMCTPPTHKQTHTITTTGKWWTILWMVKKYALVFMDESESLKKEGLKMWCDSKNHTMLNLYRIIVYWSECPFQYIITKQPTSENCTCLTKVFLCNPPPPKKKLNIVSMYSNCCMVGLQSGIWQVGTNTSDEPAASVFLVWSGRRFFQNGNQL